MSKSAYLDFVAHADVATSDCFERGGFIWEPVRVLGLALLRAQTGHDEAVRLLREAARRQPANPEIRAHLAEAGG